jgi:hypothetical protein
VQAVETPVAPFMLSRHCKGKRDVSIWQGLSQALEKPVKRGLFASLQCLEAMDGHKKVNGSKSHRLSFMTEVVRSITSAELSESEIGVTDVVRTSDDG